jgi:hypothetical protein
MAINKNHEFEELDGVKCAIVEKNVLPERVAFLQKLLSFNNYTVVVVASPPPKVAAPAPAPATATTESRQNRRCCHTCTTRNIYSWRNRCNVQCNLLLSEIDRHDEPHPKHLCDYSL